MAAGLNHSDNYRPAPLAEPIHKPTLDLHKIYDLIDKANGKIVRKDRKCVEAFMSKMLVHTLFGVMRTHGGYPSELRSDRAGFVQSREFFLRAVGAGWFFPSRF